MKSENEKQESPLWRSRTPELAPTKLDELCAELMETKQRESRVKAYRIELEEKIAEEMNIPEEGSTQKITKYYKCSGSGKLTRKIDPEKWNEISDEIPENLAPVRLKLEIDMKKLRAIEQANPELFLKISRAITSKPAKPGVKVELLQ